MIATDMDSTTSDPRVMGWVNMLVRGTSPHEVHRRLMEEREDLGSWWRVGDTLSPVLTEIGEQWERGQISVLQEHVASERLARALARCAESIAPRVDAPRALLVTAAGDDHTLGLALVELVLRESGWIARFAGRRTPKSSIQQFVESGEVQLVAVSASRNSDDSVALADEASWYGSLCQSHGATLILGGSGAWPSTPEYGSRSTSLAELHRQLAGLQQPH